jgi:hypothetical protein
MSTAARRYFLRARERLRAGDEEGAGESFSAALELCPSFVEARIGCALSLVRHDPPRAAQLLRSGLSRGVHPWARARILYALGDVLVAGGDFTGADAAYSEAGTLGGADEPTGSAGSLAARKARLLGKTARYADAFSAIGQVARGAINRR